MKVLRQTDEKLFEKTIKIQLRMKAKEEKA